MRRVDALTLVHRGTLHLGGVTGLWLMLDHSLEYRILIGPALILSGALNFHWLSGEPFSASFSCIFSGEARREELLVRRLWQWQTPGYH